MTEERLREIEGRLRPTQQGAMRELTAEIRRCWAAIKGWESSYHLMKVENHQLRRRNDEVEQRAIDRAREIEELKARI
jgi:hypothetical protein